MLPLSLDCSFLIAPVSCVPNVAIISGLMNNPEMMATLGTQDTVAIKNEQSRDNGNIGYTRHRSNQE
jgi:hypothetical protein